MKTKFLIFLGLLGLILPAFRCAENYYYRKPFTVKYEGEYFPKVQPDSIQTSSIVVGAESDNAAVYSYIIKSAGNIPSNTARLTGRLTIISDTVSFDRDSTFQLQFRGDSLTLKVLNNTKALQILSTSFNEGIYIRSTRILNDSSVKVNLYR